MEKMTLKEVAEKYRINNPGLGQYRLAQVICEDFPGQLTGIEQVRSVLRGKTPGTSTMLVWGEKQAPPPKDTGGPLSEAQLRELFDIRVMVRNALETIAQGQFWRDQDFVRRFGLHGKPGYRSVLESDQARPYRGKAQGQLFWGHPRSIEKLKEEGVLL